jgi:hypothetical protein
MNWRVSIRSAGDIVFARSIFEQEGGPMGIVTAGFDVHRAQIIFGALVSETGELARGRIGASPEAVEEWVAGFAECEIHVAVEACTGWVFRV